MKWILFATICLFAAVFGAPITCFESSIDTVLEFGDSTVPFSSTSDNCKRKDVCALSCSYIRGCNKHAFFTSFTAFASFDNRRHVDDAYKRVCIRKITDDARQSSWVNAKLIQLASTIIISNERNRLHLSSNLPLNAILLALARSPEDSLVYLGKLTNVLLTFQTMCQEDQDWKNSVSQKVRDYTDNDYSDIRERFLGSDSLKRTFVSKLRDAFQLQKKVAAQNPAIHQSMKEAKSALREVFANEIRSEKTRMVCKCEDFFTVARPYLPPQTETIARNECAKICGRNSLEASSEEEEDDDTLDFFE